MGKSWAAFHVAHRDDGKAGIRRTAVAIVPFPIAPDRRVYFHHLDRGKDLPRRHFDARYEDQLQGAGQMVYDETIKYFDPSSRTGPVVRFFLFIFMIHGQKKSDPFR